MKHLTLFLAILAGAVILSGDVRAAEKPTLKCHVGPVKKTYGNTPWLVYSCNDGKTVVVVADAGSPAAPFYFIFHPKDGSYRLHGEGTGKKVATAAALDDLKKLAEPDIKKLVAETLRLGELKRKE